MKNKLVKGLLLFCSVWMYSCSDFISKDISGDKLVTLAPADGDTSSYFSQLFWWEEVEGASDYHLQIVKPGFASIQQLLLDTVITADRFSFTLQPGTYQWRVRAQNNAGFTAYTTNTLTVDSTLDLTSQTVQLISPANNATTTDLTQSFRWYAMPYATSYTFQVLTPGNSTIYINSGLVSDSISYTFPAYGSYKWRVWAQNNASISHYSEHSITINLAGSSPSLPANNDTIPNPVAISWIRPSGIAGDSLFIYTDVNLANPVYTGYHTGTSYSFTGTSGQDYYWRLRSKDTGGNMSSYSSVSRFHVQ